MPLEMPNLDDRTAEQIYLAARERIPLYVPEWTDYNESDPGIEAVSYTHLDVYKRQGQGRAAPPLVQPVQ